MTNDHTDAAVRILTKTIRRLSKQLAEADHMASVRTSMIADTMAELDEAREGRREAECEKKREVDERVKLDGERMAELAKLRAELAEERKASHSTALSVAAGLNERLQDRIDHAMNALTADFDADTRAGDALAILRGEA